MQSSNREKAFVKKEAKKFWTEGEYNVWFSTLSIGVILFMAMTLMVVILINGLGALWASNLALVKTSDGQSYLGELIKEEERPGGKGARIQLKIGNRDLYSLDFKWIDRDKVLSISYPEDAVTLEREEYGNFYGFLKGVNSPALEGKDHGFDALAVPAELAKEEADKQISIIRSQANEMEELRLDMLKLSYQNPEDSKLAPLAKELGEMKAAFEQAVRDQEQAARAARAHTATLHDVEGKERVIPMVMIHRYYYPNQMGVGAKLVHYVGKVIELFFDDPRESNTEGGLFPAIVGTVMLVFTMSLVSFPLGVMAAVYLREYARDGILVQAIRVAVNNLAGIPSIVWGIFGLAFFVYVVGGGIDSVFFPERLPTPTFGTGGILWASATLGLLTVPVVIVATEEALGSVPSEVRHGSLALGATQFQTLMRVILPMSSPRIMTGFILAMSRAAGEVAPLMITGVVKLAPSLPIDGTFPFFHLERKFMHLGFHIYDVGFQSPNVEAAKPMVFVTTLLLLGVVILMTSVSIYLRNRMKKRFTGRTF